MDEELSMEELEHVGTPAFVELNEFMTAFEQGDMQRVTELGPRLMSNPMFDDKQREEIAKLVDQARQIQLNDKKETKGFGL